ncbi:cell wall-binding repeat-containing protein [Asaccharospora irregularis]|uniref:Putative cell wall binding repeat 2 n=1 Tax=Asaccharospora irregularis DSM 2635 TaxID=1121321 RepID=A0A1M5KBQ7_9FIRM|nr:cell wall-binding repeat-containing protein [Asaccharospora irregularis]SHG50168.1 Putative cell wall binding repeat 2 [Asaccharospora irregularis DSM 2635]
MNYINNNLSDESLFTLNTTRICKKDPIDLSIEVSKMSFTHMKPNAVILVNKNNLFDGIASASLVHFPINAPILLTDGNNLSKKTLDEIMRLYPKGYNGIQAILVGNISKNIENQLNKVGLTTYHIVGRNHYETACAVATIKNGAKNILIVSGESLSEGTPATFWSAHHGDPILYVNKNEIPRCVIDTIGQKQEVNIYIVGSTNTISESVENFLSKLPNVGTIDRITGNNPYEISVNFAKYKDNQTEFGWGRDYKDGHAFTFSSLDNPMLIVPSVLFAHMGKHTPLILVRRNNVPTEVKEYIESVKPNPPMGMPKPPYMHGFIIGSIDEIFYNTQIDIEMLLSIEHKMDDVMM